MTTYRVDAGSDVSTTMPIQTRAKRVAALRAEWTVLTSLAARMDRAIERCRENGMHSETRRLVGYLAMLLDTRERVRLSILSLGGSVPTDRADVQRCSGLDCNAPATDGTMCTPCAAKHDARLEDEARAQDCDGAS